MMLKLFATMLSGLFVLSMSVAPTYAQDPIAAALEDCSTEIESYCSSVTPGQGRLVLCAKAHEDKLSTVCISAINRAGYLVDFLASTIIYVGNQCLNDAAKLCPDVELGELRVLKCLEDQKDSLSKYCGLAIKDIGR